MQIRYFDIHSHLNLNPLSKNQTEIITKMREHSVATITVGVDLETSKTAVALAEKYPDCCFATVGLHPSDVAKEIFDFNEFKKLAEHSSVVAIGECGLDYFRDQSEQTKVHQKELFKQHITLALELGKPLMIHARRSKGTMDGYNDVLDILELYPTIVANFHFFVGDQTVATRALALGCTMSFDGPITFTHDYDDVIAKLPLSHIMAETDAPFAAPMPYRGGVCEPWMVKEIYIRIAEIRNEDREVVRKALVENALRFCGKTG